MVLFLLGFLAQGCLETCVNCVKEILTSKRTLVRLLYGQLKLDIWVDKFKLNNLTRPSQPYHILFTSPPQSCNYSWELRVKLCRVALLVRDPPNTNYTSLVGPLKLHEIGGHTNLFNVCAIFYLRYKYKLEDTALLQPRPFLPFGQKKGLLCCFCPFLEIFGVH